MILQLLHDAAMEVTSKSCWPQCGHFNAPKKSMIPAKAAVLKQAKTTADAKAMPMSGPKKQVAGKAAPKLKIQFFM
jgi:hypothetical protein